MVFQVLEWPGVEAYTLWARGTGEQICPHHGPRGI
jgi:hypothetical protein